VVNDRGGEAAALQGSPSADPLLKIHAAAKQGPGLPHEGEAGEHSGREADAFRDLRAAQIRSCGSALLQTGTGLPHERKAGECSGRDGRLRDFCASRILSCGSALLRN
jgi:hypothetical protein